MMLRIVERVVARGGPSALAARLRRGSRLILAYHNVVPDGDAMHGERSLHLAVSRFREQLDALERSHEVVSFGELIAPTAVARRPRVVITFDDAYRGCLTLALPELARRGLPVTVFVAPGLLDGDGCWWDRLADPATGVIAPADRDHVLAALDGNGAAALEWARTRGAQLRQVPATHRIGTQEELRAAARLPAVTLAPHSWSHRNLAGLPRDELSIELDRPLAWLRERFASVLPWLAFPYGLHRPEVTSAARAGGYDGVLRISGGWVTGADLIAGDLPRLNVPAGMSTDRFMLKTRGMLPL